MKRSFKVLIILLVGLLAATVVAVTAGVWHARGKLPQRSGTLQLQHLSAPVRVAYDERGIPHLQAQNETDLYRALGYVHAQDRLFQMEMVRRLARGELAEILGPKLIDTDRLFRTLGLRNHAEAYVSRIDPNSPAWTSLLAYLDGVNQFQATRELPLEFELLKITPRAFTPVDTVAISGYLAYSFAAALRTEPVLTFIRDELGRPYLHVFDLERRPPAGVAPNAQTSGHPARAPLSAADWQSLGQVAQVSRDAPELAAVPVFEGSNAWAVSGRRTSSGKPLLAGDPHIGFSLPAVWYEAQLTAPGFELYGHHQALNPFALLGHNGQFGWSLTMFQNDDLDLVAEKVNPANPSQVWYQGQWVELQRRQEMIAVKGAAPVPITLRRSPHGPIINDVFGDSLGKTPVAMWWTFLETENPLLDAFYELDRADTREKARQAASKIHAPGLNIVWANASGDIGWWAAAKLVRRPPQVNPSFILDGGSDEADKPGFYPFADNPQEENPARGYIVSSNNQPAPGVGIPVPGYYNVPDRAQRLTQLLGNGAAWDLQNSQALQLDEQTDYGPRLLRPLLQQLRAIAGDTFERSLVDQLAGWDGRYSTTSVAPTLFTQFTYELAKAAMLDELGEVQFNNLLRTRTLDHALPRLAADAGSPWWDDRNTPARENRSEIVRRAWRATLMHLQQTFSTTLPNWTWGNAHTLTHGHPLGQLKPLNLLFNVGPFPAPGGREIPNNFAYALGPAPWSVIYGPSTRRLIDFAHPGQALDINPVGQSGVLFDEHYADQAEGYIRGNYLPMHLDTADVAANTRSILLLQPASRNPVVGNAGK